MLETIPNIINDEDRGELVTAINQLAFVDGRKTAGKRAARVKKNQQIGTEDPAAKAEIQARVINTLKSSGRFRQFAFPEKIAKPLISRYQPGMEYGLHVDNAMMAGDKIRSDLSVTLFLNQPEDYEGGELEIFSGYGPVKVKLPAGSAVVYLSSTLHRVLPVISGERLAAVTWVQSQIRDSAEREILIDLERVRNRLNRDLPDDEETDRINRACTNLLRMWVGR